MNIVSKKYIRNSKQKLIVLGCIILALLIAYIGYKSIKNINGPYECLYIVDGDTICVNIDNQETIVRLIGVDTPESVASSSYHKENTPEGQIASDFLNELLKNQAIYLEYDLAKYDKYQRTLAYVYLPDGGMVNEIILKKGYGQLMTVQPNIKYIDRFIKAEKYAKEHSLGFWQNFFQDN